MNIKGVYRDVLMKNGEVIEDMGWNSNEIAEDYGIFLAALMKKDLNDVGIEYMAVGGGSEGEASFKERVTSFFKEESTDIWVWAKEIDAENDIKYLDEDGKEITDPTIKTNKLKIDVEFSKDEPSKDDPLDFREFALLGIDGSNTDTMFLINYVNHGVITKDTNMVLTRTVNLTFPTGGE